MGVEFGVWPQNSMGVSIGSGGVFLKLQSFGILVRTGNIAQHQRDAHPIDQQEPSVGSCGRLFAYTTHIVYLLSLIHI